MNKLKQEADVMINIPDDRASSNCIRIEGNKDGVKQAKEVCKLSKWKNLNLFKVEIDNSYLSNP